MSRHFPPPGPFGELDPMNDRGASLLVFTKYSQDIPKFRALLSEQLPGENIAFATSAAQAAPHLAHASVLYGWGFPDGMVQSMPKLKWVQKMGAGVEDLTGSNWPFGDSVQLTRTDGHLIAPRMVEYTIWAILRQTLRMPTLHAMRAEQRWRFTETGSIRQHTVGVAGLGEIGTEVAGALRALGANVVGWRRSHANCDAVSHVFSGQGELDAFLFSCSILVLVLPATSETAGLIGEHELSMLKPGAHIINIGRGGVIDDAALLAALDRGQLSHATLDVFTNEPLQPEHPYWTHPKVSMTPHISGPLIPEDVAPHFVANFHAFRNGEKLKNVVLPERQY